MNFDEHFTRAVALLPGPVRERLDGDFALDWPVLEDAATGAEVGDAVRAPARLPRPVEALVHRLIGDIGIVPADVAAGSECQGAASAWIHWVTMEVGGESYQLRNDRSGDVHGDIRPEAVAGYAALGLELATMLHDAVERWLAPAPLADADAQTREGLRNARVRLESELRSGGSYRVTEIDTGTFGHLTPCGLVERVRLGLAYAQGRVDGTGGVAQRRQGRRMDPERGARRGRPALAGRARDPGGGAGYRAGAGPRSARAVTGRRALWTRLRWRRRP